MRTISQTDLNRHKKRKGVNVIRKPGSETEKPEPEVDGSQSLSGETAQSEAIPVPASEFYSIMDKMIGLVDKLSGPEGSTAKEHEGKEVEQVAEAAPEGKRKRPFEILKEKVDSGELLTVIPVPDIPKPSSDWDHVYHRDKAGLVSKITSIDQTGDTWTHDFTRAGTKFLIEILSKSNTGLRLIHRFHRDDETKMIDTATTRADV